MLKHIFCRNKGVEKLLKGLQGNVCLKTLTLMDGALGKSALRQLERTLWENTSLTALHLPDMRKDGAAPKTRKHFGECRKEYASISMQLARWPSSLLKLEGLHFPNLDAHGLLKRASQGEEKEEEEEMEEEMEEEEEEEGGGTLVIDTRSPRNFLIYCHCAFTPEGSEISSHSCRCLVG